MKFDRREYLNYSDVLIKPRPTHITSRSLVKLDMYFIYAYNIGHYLVPIIASNMDTVGTFEMAEAFYEHNMMVALHKHYTVDELLAFYLKNQNTNIMNYTFVTIGLKDINKLKILQLRLDLEYSHRSPRLNLNVCIDIANGYISNLPAIVKEVRSICPLACIMVGNIASPEPIKALAKAGADIIKIGIGPGGQCRTRETAGVGIPQLSAIMSCVKEAKKHKVLICADGGITEYADFAKAFVAGADFVMAGSIFAGHDESGGEILYDKNDKPRKEVYGMASNTAMKKHNGGRAKHRASEGRTSAIPLRGPVNETIEQILGSLRSACSYTNSLNLEDLHKNGVFIKVKETINRHYEQHTTGH